jgi:secreted trypsin-like serine protease
MFLIVFIFFVISAATAKPVDNFQCGISSNVKTYNGKDQTRILGGKVSDPKDWPFIVKISDGFSYCTATIINKQWILSAAHCNEDNNPLTITTNGKTYQSNDSYLHEDYYKADLWRNDIMLIKLAEPIEFSVNVTSICLQSNLIAKNGDMAAVAGFGKRFDSVKDMNDTYNEGL